MYKFLDLFCGCGGLSLGFKMAGMLPVAGIDFNKAAVETYQLNFPDTKAICADILSMDKKAILEDLGNLDDIDIIIGGPPCQGFSNANKNYVELNDPRNKLFFEFVKFVELGMPRIVLIENVPQIITNDKSSLPISWVSFYPSDRAAVSHGYKAILFLKSFSSS